MREGILPLVRLGRQVRMDASALRSFILGGGKALSGVWRREAEEPTAGPVDDPDPTPDVAGESSSSIGGR